MSSKRVIGSAEILGNLTLNGKYAMRTFNGTAPNANTGIVTYPYYKRQEVQDILDMLPISRIGEMDYLPLNISGSFSGATSFSNDRRIQPCIIEDDGTAVILRPGTNGSQFDFYYAYVRNIRNISSLSQRDVVQTNTVYRPASLTATQKIEEFYGSDGYEMLWYRISDTAGAEQYSFTLTNSSFNVVGHQRALVPVSSMPNFSPIYCHVVGTLVYIWGWDATVGGGSGRALKLYTLPVSSIRNGVSTGFAAVTGFNGKTINNNAYTNAGNARIYDNYASTNSADDALFQYSGNMYSPEYHPYTFTNAMAYANDGNTQIRFAMFPTYRYGSAYNYSDVRMYAISMVYNIATKTFTYDNTTLGKVVVSATLDPSGNTVTYTENNPYIVNSTNWRGFSATLGNCGTICQTGDGLMFSTRSRWASDASYGISKSNINNWVSQFESIKFTGNRSVNGNTQLRVEPTYGSAVGENLMSPRFLSKTRIVLACSGTDDGVTNAGYDNMVVADIGSTRTFQYQSLTQGTINGFAPQTYRKFAANTNLRLSALVTLVDAAGNVQSHSTGFMEAVKNLGGLNINPDTLNYNGNTVSCTDTVMAAMKAPIATMAGVTMDKALIGVYYIPDTSYCNHIAVLMIRNNNNTGTIVVAEMNLTTSTAGGNITITGGTPIRVKMETIANISDVYGNNMNRFQGVTAAKYSGFNYVAIGAPHYFRVPADGRSYTAFCKFKGGQITSQDILESYYLNTYGYIGGVIPGVGFGRYNNSVNDYQTKSVFQLYGTTEAQLDGMIANTGTPLEQIVVVSQEVPEGFDVYFTQDLPVFLGGFYYKIPVQNMNLRDIQANPANTTFYVYIEMDRATKSAKYVVTTALLAESLTRAYIGTIKTGQVGIESINAEKVTRFLTYRPSVTKRGSAIPASTGVPSGPGTRWH